MVRLLCSFIVISLLSACVSEERELTDDDLMLSLVTVDSRPILFPDFPRAGRTYLFHDPILGFQIEYFSPDNGAFLWFPGNTVAVQGEYQVRRQPDGDQVCYRYFNSRHVITGERGGSFSCSDLERSKRKVVGELAGDPFNLSRGTIPYRRQLCDPTNLFDINLARYPCSDVLALSN